MAKVSIIVPCFKVEKYLPLCVESLISQTLKDTEIILVDDGSPDRSGEICDEFAAHDPRVKVIHKENGGVSAARNDGLSIATGEYVIFVDSDDYMPQNALFDLYECAEREQADMVIGDVSRVYGSKEVLTRFYDTEFVTTDREYISQLIKTVFYNRYCPNPYQGQSAFGYGGPWNKLVRHELLKRNNIRFDLRVKGIFDDIIYSAHILACSNKVCYIQKSVYSYRILSTSITRVYKSNLLEINSAIFQAWREFLEKYNSDGKFTRAYYANALRRFDDSLRRYFFTGNNGKHFSTELQELKVLMDSSPYCDIPRNVDMDILSDRHRKLAKSIARKAAFAIAVRCKLSGIKKSLKR